MRKPALLWATLLCCGTAAAAELLTLASPEYPGYIDAQGRGLYMDLARAAFPAPEFELRVAIVPFARALAMLSSGDGVVVPGSNEPGPGAQRSAQATDVDVVSAALLRQRYPLWQGIDSLRDQRVVAQRGHAYQRYTEVPMRYQEMHDLGAMLRMLVRGRVDAVLDHGPRIAAALPDLPEAAELEIKPALLRQPLFFSFRASPAGDRLRTRFDVEFQRLQGSGELPALYQRHPQVLEVAYPPAARR